MSAPATDTAFRDRRPCFWVAATGHPDAVPDGGWSASPLARAAGAHPGAAAVRDFLDAVLCRRRDGHRVLVRCRGDGAGVDEAVRAYCARRGLDCLPVWGSPDLWGAEAPLRRDLELVARAHAVVWFGPREDRDLVTLAALLGIPCRVAPLPDPA